MPEMKWAGNQDLEHNVWCRTLNSRVRARSERECVEGILDSPVDGSREIQLIAESPRRAEDFFSLEQLRKRISKITDERRPQHAKFTKELPAEEARLLNAVAARLLELTRQSKPLGLVTPESIFYCAAEDDSDGLELAIPDAKLAWQPGETPGWVASLRDNCKSLNPFDVNDTLASDYYRLETDAQLQFDRLYMVNLLYWLSTGYKYKPNQVLPPPLQRSLYVQKCLKVLSGRVDPDNPERDFEEWPAASSVFSSENRVGPSSLALTAFFVLVGIFLGIGFLTWLFWPGTPLPPPSPGFALCPDCAIDSSPIKDFLQEQQELADQFNPPYSGWSPNLDEAKSWINSRRAQDGEPGVGALLVTQGNLLLQQVSLFHSRLDKSLHAELSGWPENSPERRCLESERRRLETAIRQHYFAVLARSESGVTYDVLKPAADPLHRSIQLLRGLEDPPWKLEIEQDMQDFLKKFNLQFP